MPRPSPQSSPSPEPWGEAPSPALAPALHACQHIQREHLLAIFEHVPAGIVYMDPSGRILAVNPAFERYVGRSAEGLVSQRFADAFALGGASLEAVLEEVSRTGRPVCRQNWLLFFGSSSLSPTYWDCTVCASRDPDGAVSGLLLLITDVTVRVSEQQRALEVAESRVLRAERLSALGTLTSAIGHELRNPLGIIRNAARSLDRRAEEPERVRRLAATVEAEVQRATKIVTDVLNFARVRAPRRHPVGIRGLVQETLYRVGIPETIQVECDLSPDLPLLSLDGQQMGQVLENLIRNAVEAMPEEGVVRVTACAVAGCLELRVSDVGPGIPSDDRERIFEPLFTTKPSGTGIGLAISHRLVEAHGVTLTLETAPEESSGTSTSPTTPSSLT
jgi:PAS domain S-box-containing protein